MHMKQGEARSSLAEHAVELDRVTKIYHPGLLSRLGATLGRSENGTEPVVAVKELSLNVSRGQIVVLLGANGSGKSTMLNAIAGLHNITRGSIMIDRTGGLGIAPQHNVLWNDLTVEEHLVIFNRLKSPEHPSSKEDIAELVRSIDLHPKRSSLAKTLSGGQKRKLQLCMMLTGGSAVCCVDEVSSGLDPLSRRKIWDILLAERGKRTLILTTHFLEADLLADHIAILSKGTLRAAGSSVELKNKLAGGYRVHVPKDPRAAAMPEIDGVQKKDALDVTYSSPTSGLAAELVKRLDAAAVTDYHLSGPTIEDVFLRLAEEVKEDQVPQGAANGALDPDKGRRDADDSSQSSGAQQNLKLMDGTGVGYARQAAILLRKRATVFKRNWTLYVVAFGLPIFAAALTSLYVRNKDPMGCSAVQQSSNSGTQDAFSQVRGDDRVTFLAGPPSRFDASSAARLLAPIFAGSGGDDDDGGGGGASMGNFRVVDSYGAFERFITDNRENLTTGLWLGDDGSPPTVGWVANLFITSSLTAQQFLDVLVTNTTIATTWVPFEVPFNPGIGDALNLVVYMGIALACYPAFFGLYPSNERRRFVRALQYSNGARPLPLWAAYLAFDFTIALVATAIAVGLWAALSNIWYHLEYVFVVFFLYGLASTILAYFVSLLTKTQLSSFAWAAAYQGVLFLIYIIAYVCSITYVSVNKIDSTILICHFVISLFAPIGSAMRALFISTNLLDTACDGQHISTRPGSFDKYGGPIAYLVIQCLVLFGLLIWFDSGSVGSTIGDLVRKRSVAPTGDEEQEGETAEETKRVGGRGVADDGLRVMHLTKSFGDNTAVDNVTFGIKRGEVFALLGPNGAGKSTTISLIRGDLKPSGRAGGDVLAEDTSVTRNLAAARRHLGVCPQIDALDQMTVREHLEFYVRIRGVADVEHNVSAVLRAVGLEAMETRMGHALSGGNKRKLSLGIALMGNPTVVLLDEPSSGLDAAAKRVMWRTLARAMAGRCILLTTHSMEEADALAGRAGILSRRMLALGTPDDLRRRFGDALHVHLVARSAPRTPVEDMDRIASFVRATFPSASVEAETHHGQLRFSVGASDVVSESCPSPVPSDFLCASPPALPRSLVLTPRGHLSSHVLSLSAYRNSPSHHLWTAQVRPHVPRPHFLAGYGCSGSKVESCTDTPAAFVTRARTRRIRILRGGEIVLYPHNPPPCRHLTVTIIHHEPLPPSGRLTVFASQLFLPLLQQPPPPFTPFSPRVLATTRLGTLFQRPRVRRGVFPPTVPLFS